VVESGEPLAERVGDRPQINDTGNCARLLGALTRADDKVDFPSVHWAGWYDIFLIGSLSGFDGYQKLSQPSCDARQSLR
jgi:predicted acyl esterase